MDEIGPTQIELKVHGLTSQDHGRVPARVFANKLKQLVSVLEAADTFRNGRIMHSYVLASMHMSEPTAVLAEIPLDAQASLAESAIPPFRQAIESIKTQDTNIEKLAPIIRKISLLASGAESKFSFAEIKTSGENIVRIDEFLRKRTNSVRRASAEQWFTGAAFGSFDGKLEYVDTRGSLPQIKLLLTAGGKEIDCVCRREDVETLGDALTKRVRIYGRSIYDGSNPLPIRIEVTSIEPVSEGSSFSHWKGSFRPFNELPWESDSEEYQS